MAVWDIDVPGTHGVLTAASKAVTGLQTPVKSLGAALEGVAGAVPSTVVVQALGGFAENGLSPDLTGAVLSAGAALSGTTEAVGHYVAGDQAMATIAEKSALIAAGTGPALGTGLGAAQGIEPGTEPASAGDGAIGRWPLPDAGTQHSSGGSAGGGSPFPGPGRVSEPGTGGGPRWKLP
ncbi:DUF6507 family protein [Paenarthrobacter sp. NPDC089714]|uniref:DUF6507 family protein n=1 Tax=Paenarthrobacter sp. NPDC089714 TaxID=3364377 RepID=UPI0037FD9F97